MSDLAKGQNVDIDMPYMNEDRDRVSVDAPRGKPMVPPELLQPVTSQEIRVSIGTPERARRLINEMHRPW